MAKRIASIKEFIRFYRFWAWQYAKRNPDFQRIIELVGPFYDGREESRKREILKLGLEADRCKDGIMLNHSELLDRYLMNHFG